MRLTRLITVAVVAALLAASSASARGCAPARGPFHVRGTQVVGSGGNVFTPYGVTVSGLSYSLHYYLSSWVEEDYRQIRAAAQSWCANTIRLQISQDGVVHDGPAFMAALAGEVTLAESLGMVVVLNDQTESDPTNGPMPTRESSAFWRKLAPVYGRDQHVIADLFNEPRQFAGAVWHSWRFHMQRLANVARDAGIRNVIWVEGPMMASTLSLVARYPIHGPDLVYAIHHPQGEHKPSAWEADFGFLVDRHVAAVVEGEWTNWASTHSECWADAPTVFLRYLRQRRIGMTVWSLNPGVLAGNDPSIPDRFNADWSCIDGLGEGAGALIRRWYQSAMS
jgi:hypothetical protein